MRAVHLIIHGAMAQQDGRRSVGQGGGGGSEGELPGGQQGGGEHQSTPLGDNSQCSTVQYSTVQYSTVEYNTAGRRRAPECLLRR